MSREAVVEGSVCMKCFGTVLTRTAQREQIPQVRDTDASKNAPTADASPKSKGPITDTNQDQPTEETQRLRSGRAEAVWFTLYPWHNADGK